jgi:pSer/pThr/pTyr-binding forkhead associated (FHA) protein
MDAVGVILVLAIAVLVAGGLVVWQQRRKPKENGLDTLMVKPSDAGIHDTPVRFGRTVTSEANVKPELLEGSSMGALEVLQGPEAIVGGQRVGNRIEIIQKKTTIGRNPRQVDIQLYNLDEPSSVSRLHCTIEFFSAVKCFMITDEGSSSGTKVSGTVIPPFQPMALQNGDIIELGIVERMGAVLKFETVFNPPDSLELQGGRLRVHTGIEPKDTLRRSLDSLKEEGAAEKWDVFVSYSRRDRDVMRYIRESLVATGLKVWSDESLEPGSKSWRLSVERAIENSACVLVILSPEAKQSEWVGEEINYAHIHKVRIFTVLTKGDESDSVPLGLTGMQWIDMRMDYETALEQIIRALREHLKRD